MFTKSWVFLHLGKVVKSRPVQRLNKEGTAEVLTKDAQNLKLKVKTTVEALGDFLGSIRELLLIEAWARDSHFVLLRPLLPSIGTWVVIILIVIAGVVVVVMALAVFLWKEGNKMLRMEPSSNPSLS